MKAVYITSDQALAESLKRQLAEMSPSMSLEICARAAGALGILMSGVVDAVLIDTQLPDEDTSILLAEIRLHELPLVVIVAAASGVRTDLFWPPHAEYVWAHATDSGQSLTPEMLARDVSMAILRAVQRRPVADADPESRLCVVYIGEDEQLCGFLEDAPGVWVTRISGPGCDVALIDASPYSAIKLLGTLREAAPTLPAVLLCGPEVRDPNDVATMLAIDQVLVRSGNWLSLLSSVLRTVARQGRLAARGVREQEVAADTSLPSLGSGVGLGTGWPLGANSEDRVRSHADALGNDLRISVRNGTLEREQGAEAFARTISEGHDHLQALTTQQEQALAAERVRCDDLQWQLDEKRATETRLTSMLQEERSEGHAKLQALTAQQKQALAAERLRRDDLQRQLDEKRATETRLTSML